MENLFVRSGGLGTKMRAYGKLFEKVGLARASFHPRAEGGPVELEGVARPRFY